MVMAHGMLQNVASGLTFFQGQSPSQTRNSPGKHKHVCECVKRRFYCQRKCRTMTNAFLAFYRVERIQRRKEDLPSLCSMSGGNGIRPHVPADRPISTVTNNAYFFNAFSLVIYTVRRKSWQIFTNVLEFSTSKRWLSEFSTSVLTLVICSIVYSVFLSLKYHC